MLSRLVQSAEHSDCPARQIHQKSAAAVLQLYCLVNHLLRNAILTSEPLFIRAENSLITSWICYRNKISVERTGRIEVERKCQTCLLKNQDLIHLMRPHIVCSIRIQYIILFSQRDHLLIKQVQPAVLQILIIYQTPLTSAVMITPAIALSRKINPFRMPEFIAHEIQVAVAA